MIVKEDLQAFKQIARQSQYTLGTALSDLTGVGTLYSLGADYANKTRLEKMDASTKQIPLFNGLVKEYLTSSNYSFASKIAYLSSLAATGSGYLMGAKLLLTAGLTGSAGLATLFMVRAGYNSADQTTVEQQLASAGISEKEKTV